jgi:hypothetical protein
MTGDGRRWLVAFTKKHHGLGNRVRVVLGSRVLARAEGRRFGYVWHVGPQFGARLDELWEFHDRRIPATVSRALAVRYPFRDHTLGWLDEARGDRLWQIRTPHALLLPEGVRPWDEELRDLRPTEPVRHAVRDFHSRYLAGAPYVGVMLRAHPISHAETLAASPVEWYVARLNAVREAHPELRFFVSADTPEGLARLQAQVPGCVGITDKGAYNSREGLRAAVTDLYLLAGSAHLVGPHFSSFPELAQRLAGPQLRLETSRTPPSAAFEAGPLSLASDPVLPHRRDALRLR